MKAPSISVVIISYNCKDILIECIKSIILSCYENQPEIIVVDNNSSDGTVKTIKKLYPDIKLIENSENLGYSKAINVGAKNAKGDYLILSNADVIYHTNTIFNLVEYLIENPEAGVTGPQQVYKNGQWQRSFGFFPGTRKALKDLFLIEQLKNRKEKKLFKSGMATTKEVEYIDGAVLATRKNDFEMLNGFDEDYFFFSEEADYCFRILQIGKKNIFIPKEHVVHFRGGSQKKSGMNRNSIKMNIESQVLFIKKNKTGSVSFYLTCEYIHFKILSILAGNEGKKKNLAMYLEVIKEIK